MCQIVEDKLELEQKIILTLFQISRLLVFCPKEMGEIKQLLSKDGKWPRHQGIVSIVV